MFSKLMTFLTYASSVFVFIPAGRDMVSYATPLLPGEEITRPMMMMKDPKVHAWMWGMWGFNHCFISLLKVLAVKNKDKSMLKMLAVSSLVLLGYCVMGEMAHGEMMGFVVLCVVQTASLGYLGM